MISNDELLEAARDNTGAADEGLKVIRTFGLREPVPPQAFAIVLQRLRSAEEAVEELETRAVDAAAKEWKRNNSK